MSRPAPRRFPRHRRTTAAFALAVGLVGLAACSDDSASATSPEACDAFAGLGAAMTGDPAAAGPALEAFEEQVTGDLAEPAETVVTTLSAVLDGGDPSGMESPEFVEASTTVGDAMFEGCDVDAKVEVTGVDYAFEGLPDEIDAGRLALRFVNETEADEPHELVLMRRADGVDDPVEDLLALPEEELGEKLEMVGVAYADAAGGSNVTFLELEAGEYVAICMLPVGGGEDGDPHAVHGMTAELSVV